MVNKRDFLKINNLNSAPVLDQGKELKVILAHMIGHRLIQIPILEVVFVNVMEVVAQNSFFWIFQSIYFFFQICFCLFWFWMRKYSNSNIATSFVITAQTEHSEPNLMINFNNLDLETQNLQVDSSNLNIHR